ncbi:MAG: hypothetical protein H6686_07790 [Fibrobacteria bacterium]|nr:hypothetical protein [Fibrobacteria bacterium]
MIRSLTTSALVGACFAASVANAAEVTFSGSVDAGTLVGLDTLADAPMYSHNVEANLTANIKFSDAVSAQLYGAALAGAVPTVGASGAAGRWPGFAFDGATLTWAIDEDMTLVVGDVVVGKGSIGYYALKRYTGGARTEAVQGASFTAGGLTVYAGNPDIQDDVTAIGASYMATLAEGMTLEPFADITTGISKNLPWTAGAQFKGEFGPLSLGLTGSVFGADNRKDSVLDDPETDPDESMPFAATKHAIGFSVVAEPNLSFGDFSLSNAVVFAPKAEATAKGEAPEYSFPIRHGRTYDAIGEDLIVYTEPGYKFSDLVAVGFAVEYKDTDMSKDKTENTSFTPNLYLYPVEDALITVYGGGTMYTTEGRVKAGETDPMTFFAGFETVYSF